MKEYTVITCCAVNLQALTKLLNVACDSSWNNHGTALATEFLRLLLTIDDGLQRDRLYEILMHPKAGIAVIAAHEQYVPIAIRGCNSVQ